MTSSRRLHSNNRNEPSAARVWIFAATDANLNSAFVYWNSNGHIYFVCCDSILGHSKL